MFVIDEPGAPESIDRSFWRRIRDAFRTSHPDGINVNPPAPMNIRPSAAPKAPPPPSRCRHQ